jgi:ABC-type cobalamin transport system ATPase subunit
MTGTTEPSKAMTLEVYNPAGNTQLVQSHALRLDTLAGKTICELSNGEWGAQRIFPAIREALQKRFPDLKMIPYTEFPVGTEKIDNETATDRVVSRGCQAVISGNAG